jgi:hypothetical protein
VADVTDGPWTSEFCRTLLWEAALDLLFSLFLADLEAEKVAEREKFYEYLAQQAATGSATPLPSGALSHAATAALSPLHLSLGGTEVDDRG